MTHDQVAADIARSLGRSPESMIEVVGSGTINRVFVADDMVIRVNHDRVPEEAVIEYRKEAWCHAQAAAHGIRVPEIYEVGMRAGLAYIAMERIHGEVAEASDPLAWRMLGGAAKRLHGIEGPSDAEERAELFTVVKGKTAEEAWREVLDRNVQELAPDDPLEALGVYSAPERDELLGRFRKLGAHPFRYGLCHGDLHPRNLMFTEDREPCLLDWGCATLSAVPHDDLNEIVRNYLLLGVPDAAALDAFLDGYGEEAIEAMAIENDILLIKAFDLVRWALDRAPERLDELVDRAKAVRRAIGSAA